MKIYENGIESVLNAVTTARGKKWTFSLLEKTYVCFNDLSYAYLIKISGGADAKAWNHALAPIREVEIPHKRGVLKGFAQYPAECNAFLEKVNNTAASGSVRIFLLPSGAEGAATCYIDPRGAGFTEIAQKRHPITPKDLPSREFKLLRVVE